MLSKIKRIYLWWVERHERERKAILHLPNRTPVERCADLIKYLGQIEFTMSRQALGFYQTRLIAVDQSEFLYIVGYLNRNLKLKGGLIREEVSQLSRLYTDKHSSMASFFGNDDFTKTFKSFHIVIEDFVNNLLALQDQENIESVHTLRIIAPFIEALKETLETLVRTTQ